MTETTLNSLEETLPTYEIATQFTDYLRALKFLHEICVSQSFEPILYNEVLSNFNAKFELMKTKFNISETFKIHVIKDHFKYFFDQTGIYHLSGNPEQTLLKKL